MQRPRISVHASPRDIAVACDALYECPHDVSGHRTGPLVGYTARDSEDRQLVGDVYIDFARIEQWPYIVQKHIAPVLHHRVEREIARDVVWCGMPEGGKLLASVLAGMRHDRYVFPEKVTVAPATATAKARSESRFTGRHVIHPGDKIVMVEDVSNNFSTTSVGIREVARLGGEVVAIVSFLNRSPFVRDTFECDDGSFPVISLWDEAMPEYRQGDLEVVRDIEAGNVVLEPKMHWDELMAKGRVMA